MQCFLWNKNNKIMQIPNEQDFNMALHMLLSELLDLEASTY